MALNTALVVELVNDQSGVETLDYEDRLRRKQEFLQGQERLKQIAAVTHPNLARVIDVLEFEERHFLVREWVEGYTLRDLVEQSLKPLPQQTASEFCTKILALLEELQEQDPAIVLGTLCPDYIVVDPDGDLKVIDFGLGVHAPGKTEFEPYSCPELLGGGDLDLRADLYSLGAVLYFAVSGTELPPIWDRITCQDNIPSPSELEIQVDGRFWAALEAMLSLNIEQRPQSIEATKTLLESGEFADTPESSPATWYPEQSNLLLGDSYPYAPFAQPDWILKMVQAAMVGRARGLAVTQNREVCTLEFQFAAPDVPSPKSVLDALTTNAPVPNPAVAELACGLRVIGEFRSFRLTLDDWKHSWTLSCRGGRINSQAGPSYGRSGLTLEVRYEGRGVQRAEQAADELIRLVRRTRLCTVPITVGKRPLDPGRGVDVSELSKEVVELYLASASFPAEGGFRLSEEPQKGSGAEKAYTAFEPKADKLTTSHVDVRCYVAPGEGKLGKLLPGSYEFLRRPSRILWYRRGVLCAESFLEKRLPLQLDIHLSGDHLQAESSGLKLQLPDWVKVSRLRPVLELSRILPVTRLKLEEYWEMTPTEASPKSNALVGALGAPVMLLFFSGLVGPGLVFLKKAALAGLLKTTSATGAILGYGTSADHLQKVRKACLKALDAFEKEEIG